MKKVLLLAALAAVSGGTAVAQTAPAHPVLSPKYANRVLGNDVASKTTKNGDTIIKTNIILSGTGKDTLTFYGADLVLPRDTGYITGYNNLGYKAFAELYRINNMGGSGNDSTISVIGMYTYMYGRVSSSSTKQVILTAWTSGARTNPEPTRTKLFFSGKPTTVLGSSTVPLKSFAVTPATGGVINTDTIMYFSTASTYTNKDFYVGVQFPNYNYANLGGDTAILISTQDGNRRNNTYREITGTDSVYLMQNLAQKSDGTWEDFFQEGPYRLAFHLFALPVIKIKTTIGVNNSVVKNDLTVYGTFPNPTNSNTNFKFALANGANVSVELMDVMGRKLRTIQNGALGAGEHILNVETADLASGNYLITLRTSNGDGMAVQMTVAK